MSSTVQSVLVQMKDCTFSGRARMSEIPIFQDFKSACDACENNNSTAICLFKQWLTGREEGEVRTRVTSTISANVYYEDALKSYSSTVQFLLKCYVSDDNLVEKDAEVRNLRYALMTWRNMHKNCGRRQWAVHQYMMKNHSRRSSWKELSLLLPRFARRSDILPAQHQHALLDDLPRGTDLLLDLHGG